MIRFVERNSTTRSLLSLPRVIALVALVTLATHLPTLQAQSPSRPNIVFILADDLGYGDVKCFGGDHCRVETPGFDRIAREGMRLTNAHANASVCVPTRIAIMSGRYPWRFSRPGPGGPWGFLGTRFDTDTHTLGKLMKDAGYQTGYVGKWHLGTLMPTSDDRPQGTANVDYTKPLKIGPPQYGFDESFILPGSLDMFPYAFVRNNQWVGQVTAQKGWSAFNRVGPAAEDFEDTKVLDTLTSEAEGFIAKSANRAKLRDPFFLFFALTAPHTPVSPSAEFEGTSQIGIYGDFIMEADDCVDRILSALDQHGLTDNTLVIATSDHGPAPYAGRRREATYLQLKELEQEGHDSNGPYRGYKFSVYEGGTRVPFVARWPGVIEPNTTSDCLVALQDLMATLAEITDIELRAEQAVDSISMLPVFQDADATATRRSLIQQATRAMSVRADGWKLALCPGSGSDGRFGNTPRREQAWRDAVKQFGRPPRSPRDLVDPAFVQLFYLPDDPGETTNLAAKEMDRVRELMALLQQGIENGRTTPGRNLTNQGQPVQPFSAVPAFVWAPVPSSTQPLRCVETEQTVSIMAGEKPILSYQKTVKPAPEGIDSIYQRSGYLHPLVTPNGRMVTGDFPADHPHQHAIFNAWVRTTLDGRPLDFWNQRAALAGVAHSRVISTDGDQGQAGFAVELLHEAFSDDGDPTPILKETWRITARPPQQDAYVFDLESTQVCIAESPLVIEEYHYGGMALRGSNQWYSEQGAEALTRYQRTRREQPDAPLPGLDVTGHQFTTSENQRRFDGNHSRPRWVDLSGTVDGQLAGITVLGHRSNFRYPQPVRLHPTKPYFCFSPMVLGRFELKPGEPLISRFRYIVHDGPVNRQLVETQWREYR